MPAPNPNQPNNILRLLYEWAVTGDTPASPTDISKNLSPQELLKGFAQNFELRVQGEKDAWTTNDVEVLNANTYLGQEHLNGEWRVIKITPSGVQSSAQQYATVGNNGGTTDYSTAWTNRASLNYQDYGA